MIITLGTIATTTGLTPEDLAFLDSARAALDPSDPMLTGPAIVALVLSIVGAAGLAWVVMAIRRRDRATHGQAVRRMTLELRLSADQRRLVRRAARTAGLSSAVGMLLSRGCFDHVVRAYVPARGEGGALRAIRNRVFDDRD